MKNSFNKIVQGYQAFREKYVLGDQSIMQLLHHHGQSPSMMVVACCDSRVDPALILQCDPGDLFVVRNVANIVPPYEKDEMHHGTSAALEFGINFLKVKHLVLLGHSQCGGIRALIDNENTQNDFISNWVSIVEGCQTGNKNVDDCARLALNESYKNCLSFPWIVDRMNKNELIIHRWFFDIELGQIFTYAEEEKRYQALV